jgi:hypothetical protein
MPDKKFSLKDIPWALRRLKRPKLRLRALEPRYMFDGGLLVSAAELSVLPERGEVQKVYAEKLAAEKQFAEAQKSLDDAAKLLSAAQAAAYAPGAAVETSERVVVFVDTTVKGWQQLVAQADPAALIVRLDPTQDGLAQITKSLSELTNVGSVSIISHGSDGQLVLGGRTYSTDALLARSADLAAISGALTADADILLYGCDLAAGSAGKAFVDTLAQLTSADVAASVDKTGASELGGDWTLEYSTGKIHSFTFVDGQTVYGSLLANAAPVITNSVLTVSTTAGGGQVDGNILAAAAPTDAEGDTLTL